MTFFFFFLSCGAFCNGVRLYRLTYLSLQEILRDDVDENSDELMTESDDERFQAL